MIHPPCRATSPRPKSDYSLEARARSWIDVNCSYCHQDGGNVPATWDGLAHTALFDTGMVNGIVGGGVFHPADRLLVPGQEEHSVIVHRAAARNGYTRMPPLASSAIDEIGVQLLIDWIEGELPARQSYDDGVHPASAPPRTATLPPTPTTMAATIAGNSSNSPTPCYRTRHHRSPSPPMPPPSH